MTFEADAGDNGEPRVSHEPRIPRRTQAPQEHTAPFGSVGLGLAAVRAESGAGGDVDHGPSMQGER